MKPAQPVTRQRNLPSYVRQRDAAIDNGRCSTSSSMMWSASRSAAIRPAAARTVRADLAFYGGIAAANRLAREASVPESNRRSASGNSTGGECHRAWHRAREHSHNQRLSELFYCRQGRLRRGQRRAAVRYRVVPGADAPLSGRYYGGKVLAVSTAYGTVAGAPHSSHAARCAAGTDGSERPVPHRLDRPAGES